MQRIPRTLPRFSTEAVRLAAKRDTIRVSYSTDPRIRTRSDEISRLVADHMKSIWEEHITKASFNGGTKNLWKTLKGPTRVISKNDIYSNGRTIENNRRTAEQGADSLA